MPKGFEWDQRFMRLATEIASWSKDPSTKVGAIIVDEVGRIAGCGFNGFPRGVEDYESRYEDREVKYSMVVHAELNAILNSMRRLDGAIMYCTLCPCRECAKAIIQSGITAVYYPDSDNERWTESQDTAKMMFEEAGVTFHKIYLTSDASKDEEIPF